MFKKLLFGIASMILLFQMNAQGQDSSGRFDCKLPVSFIEAMSIDSPGHGASSAITLPASFPASAIDTCGKFRVFYADVEIAPGTGIYKGFADATWGTTRRNTMCAALNYIQSRIDFSSLADSEYVRLYVDTSCSSVFPAGKHYISGFSMYSFLALASPYHAPMSLGDTVNGFVHDFITSGIDPNIGDYHGYLKMNFDSGYIPSLPRPILYNNGLGDPDCTEFDLFSVLTHYVTHTMGWFSWSDSLHTGVGSLGHYTNYDLALHKTPWMKLAVNPFASITKVFPSSPVFAADYWVNGNLPPDNYPVEPASPSHLIGGFHRGGSSMSYYTHRVSPGESFDHVMGDAFHQGAKKRALLKGDWETLHNNIGYNYNSSFATDSAVVIANHLPHSVKMGADTLNRLFYFYFVQSMPEYIPADYNIRNDVGTSVTIHLNALADLQDADSDSISIYPGSIVNFRGCGIGGNNHHLLSVSNSGKTITYTPRANFYGRAQFGFNLYDQKEKGGFVVFTIDVTKGNNVSVLTGDNIALNGDFEEGSEVKTNDTNLHIPNVVFRRLELSQHMSDSHPYEYSNAHFGTAIRNSHKVCLITPYTLYDFGHDWNVLNFSGPFMGGTYTAPNPYLGVGNRYQPIATHPTTFYLADTLLSCHRYVLEFDATRTLSVDPTILPYPAFDSIIIGFARDTFFNPTNRVFSMKQMKPYPTDSIKLSTWHHFSIPFTYCDDSSANILTLYIKGLNGYAPPQIIDNVSLKETTEPLSFNLKDSAIGTCSRRLYSDLYDLGCSSLSYEWRKLGDATVIASTSSIDVSNTTETSYTLSISDGCSTGYDTFTVAPCPCSVGAVFGADKDSILPASFSGSLSSGFYHLTGNLLITDATTLTNALVLIEPDVRITVVDSALLILDNCHLLTCPDTNKLWKGIDLASGALKSGRIELKNNTMIEDAEVAISALSPRTPASGNIIDINNAVFNRNLQGLYIENYTSTTTAADYPFSVVNTVFTSRQFDTLGLGYPLVWKEAKDLKDTAGNGIYAPYYIDVHYSKVKTKNDKLIEAGIKLKNVGNAASGTYYGIVVGGGIDSTDANLFDNTSTGIYAEQSNLSCYNNIFNNMIPTTGPATKPPSSSPKYLGCGIYANTLGATPRRLRVVRDPLVNGVSNNKFFDCATAVHTVNFYETEVNNAKITSSNASASGYASTGIYCVTASPCLNFNLNYNEIANIPVGIQVFASNISASETGKINGNTLSATNPWLPSGVSSAGQYMQQAILIDGSAAGLSSTKPFLKADSNNIQGAYNGIAAENVINHRLQMKTNNLSELRLLSPAKVQYGISVKNCFGALVSNNSISMNSLSSSNKLSGVYAAFNTNLQVCANSTTNIDRAFDFAQIRAQAGTRWVLNSMDNSNMGFVLGSDIGDQGYTFIDMALIRHRYEGTGNTWLGTTWNTGKWQTFVENGLNTNNSKLYVRSGMSPNEEPTFNYAKKLSPVYPDLYDLGSSFTGSLKIRQDLTNCDGILFPSYYRPVPGVSGAPHIKSVAMLILSDSLGYGDKAIQWMAQLSLYESGLQEPLQADSFELFDNFMSYAASSRFKWITDVQTALDNADTASAASLLTSIPEATGRQVIDTDLIITDEEEADGIVANYFDYYQAYLQYLKNAELDTTGLQSLSNKCPALDGAVVYKARALYSLLTATTVFYEDDSCMYGGGHYRMAENDALTGNSSAQAYTLYPNPNNGSFVVKQNIAEDKVVNLKVYNAIGAIVYESKGSFVQGQLKVVMGQQTAGIYLVCIGDDKTRTTCLRFMIK